MAETDRGRATATSASDEYEDIITAALMLCAAPADVVSLPPHQLPPPPPPPPPASRDQCEQPPAKKKRRRSGTSKMKDLICYGDNGVKYSEDLLAIGPETDTSASYVAAAFRLDKTTAEEMLAKLPLPKRNGLKSQHKRKRAITCPGSSDDPLEIVRNAFCGEQQQQQQQHRHHDDGPNRARRIADALGRAFAERGIFPRSMIACEGVHGDREGDGSESSSSSSAVVAAAAAAAAATGSTKHHGGNNTAATEESKHDRGGSYREPNSVHICMSIDVLSVLPTGSLLSHDRLGKLGRALGTSIEKVGKKSRIRINGQQVFFYPQGRIECLKTATAVGGLRALSDVFSELVKCGYLSEGSTFSAMQPKLKRALFDAKLGFPVDLAVFRRFMIDEVGESPDSLWFPEGQTDRIKMVLSDDVDSTVQMYSSGSVNYFVRYDPSGSDDNRDDILVARYTSLHRLLFVRAHAAMMREIGLTALGPDIGSLPIPLHYLELSAPDKTKRASKKMVVV